MHINILNIYEFIKLPLRSSEQTLIAAYEIHISKRNKPNKLPSSRDTCVPNENRKEILHHKFDYIQNAVTLSHKTNYWDNIHIDKWPEKCK